MSHVGTSEDRFDCFDCGIHWSGPWALDDSGDHSRANPDHLVHGRIILPRPIGNA